jgi:hypothetical protein
MSHNVRYTGDLAQASSWPWARVTCSTLVPRKRKDTDGQPNTEVFPESEVQKGCRGIRCMKDDEYGNADVGFGIKCLLYSA